jgi:hypothetical protein
MRHNGQTYWQAKARSCFYIPNDDTAFVVASDQEIAEVIDLAGNPPPLQRDVERLLGHTDRDRLLTILLTPNSLFNEGQSIFKGQLSPMRQAMFWFLGDELSAAALSAHLDENFFLELTAIPTLDTPPQRAAQILAERVALLPRLIDDYVSQLNPRPHGRHVLMRFPTMVRQLADHTRFDVEDQHVVLRCYLPSVAAHNLILGAELTLAESMGTGITAGESPSALADSRIVAERLKRRTSLRLAHDTLEAALEILSQDLGININIIGGDLAAEGITKNQSLSMEINDRPAEEILVEILRMANPDKTPTTPADERQKLVYVISPGTGGAATISITTRAGAVERGESLPKVFQRERP